MALSVAEVSRRYRERHPDRVRARSDRHRKEHPDDYRRWEHARRWEKKQALIEQFGGHCTDCNMNLIEAPECADFDHLENKSFGIGRRMNVRLETLIEEVKKCELVCANCHRKRTVHRGIG